MSKGHILVIEDHPDNQQLVTWILEDEGYQVTCAGTAEEGLERLEAHPDNTYLAVLMDISLPGIDGTEATRILRENPRFSNLPVVALTAHAIADEQRRILESGVSELLTKPVDEEQLLSYLHRVKTKQREG